VDDSQEFRHVAAQLPGGRWTSKLGDWEDIEHVSLDVLRGPIYGTHYILMKRPARSDANLI